MPKLTPEEAARKLVENAQAAAPRMAEQIAKVTVNPAEVALQKADKWRAGIQEAIANGSYERGLRRTSLEDWRTAMIQKGIPRLAQGLQQALPKIEAFNRRFYPYLERVEAEVAAMDDTSFEARINRMVHNARRIHEFKNE